MEDLNKRKASAAGAASPAGAASAADARIVLFGATSGIARAVSERFAKKGERLILIGRDLAGLEALARDLEKIAGQKFPVMKWDVLDFPSHAENFQRLAKAHSLKGVFFAAGVLFQQDECDRDSEKDRKSVV